MKFIELTFYENQVFSEMKLNMIKSFCVLLQLKQMQPKHCNCVIGLIVNEHKRKYENADNYANPQSRILLI